MHHGCLYTSGETQGSGTQLAWSIASGGRAGACVGSETTLVRQEQKKACKP